MWLNDEVFNNRIIGFNRKRAVVNSYNHEFAATFTSQAIAIKGRHLTRLVSVRWSKPPLGWRKLNTNGSFHWETKVAGSGGILRNNKGEREDNFSVWIECNNIKEAET